MSRTLGRHAHPRTSLLPAAAALLVGLLLHAIDQSIAFRAGPGPILVTAPVVATLCYLRVREASSKRILGLLGWGVAGSGLGVLGVYVVAVSYLLPRELTGQEMVLYDLGMFLWFVVALAAAYVVAGSVSRPLAAAALLGAPVAQASVTLVLVLLVELGLFA
ncbi:hypothetical protein NDI76_01310 [Halogeometricum sp. S1BR25-6]|uniref:Uncharacterized protein n=1 Tax=Halogeometricum salsisoli TaxID=2950536 RepID=A0ABU2G998_9EURY|nr:hypothetical protein [Halogeometricum sp. S1BR25-6]MDS0297378.1 hypothetical protein [Halogeometricum sp. S1BR25-6]